MVQDYIVSDRNSIVFAFPLIGVARFNAHVIGVVGFTAPGCRFTAFISHDCLLMPLIP